VVVWLLKGWESVVNFFARDMERLASNVIVYLEVIHVIRGYPSASAAHYRPERYVSNFKGDIERCPTSDVKGALRLMRAGERQIPITEMPLSA